MNHPPLLPAPLYQGSVNTWECDEGGHLNVRFQLERATAGLAHLANALGLPRAFTPFAGSTLVLREAHIRFLKEALPGAGLVMHGGVVKLEERHATFCLDMRHADGAPATTFTMRAAHVETRELRSFPWSARSRAAAARLSCALPAHAKPRSLDPAAPPAAASRERAIELGALRIGAALVTPDQCDAFGRLRAEHIFGRISDSAPNLLARWREQAATREHAQPAGAVVEARMVFRRWPRAGDLLEVFSGVAEVSEKTHRLVHWLCDPESGAAWASVEVMALTFDVTSRKTIRHDEATLEQMRQRVIAISV